MRGPACDRFPLTLSMRVCMLSNQACGRAAAWDVLKSKRLPLAVAPGYGVFVPQTTVMLVRACGRSGRHLLCAAAAATCSTGGARGAVPPRPSCRQLRASRRVVFAESASMTAVCSRTWPAASQPAAGPAPAVARPVAGKLRGTCRLEAALSGFRAHR